ncbi:MAG: stage V sporulation protein AE [Ruminococcus sp.]|nr:stage V sporulation protein AE [Ruminococcus sp.]
MNFLWAFLIGGTLCAIGQILIDYTKLTPARILVAYVVTGVILGGLGWYEPILEFAGGGASVPLTGFGNLLAEGVKKAVGEYGLLGVFLGGMSSAAGGITAALIFGLLVALIFRPKEK